MNLPNRLTLLRMVLVPFLVLFMLCKQIPYSDLFALLVFVIASITDFFDGKIARSRNLVTNFGKFLDPMADKVIVLSAMICLSSVSLCHPVVVIIVASREFMISSLRLVAASQGIVLAAGWSGKVKTASQMISIVVVLAMLSINQFFNIELLIVPISNCLMWITAFITVYSGIEYLIQNRKLVDHEQ